MTTPAGSVVNVLVIDDKLSVRLTVSKLLGHIGVSSISVASSGAEAIALIEHASEPFDVAICDLAMPNEDGLVFLRRLGGLTTRPAVILMSGRDPAFLDAARQLGERHGLRMLGTLPKPVSRARLASLLAAATAPAASAGRRAPVVLADEELEAALETGLFELWFQPQCDIRTGSVKGVEGLLRLHHARQGILSPASFLEMAERQGLTPSLTAHVLDQAVTWGGRWRALGHELTVSVNLPKTILNDFTLPERAVRTCRNHRLPPGRLVFEVTESTVAADATTALDILADLHLHGFRLSLDDFGTGFTTLEELRSLPFHELKLDRRLVQGAVANVRARTILEKMIVLASELKMSTVAEGVETRDQLALVASLGCHLVQGYLVARPMPAADVSAWIRRSSAAVAELFSGLPVASPAGSSNRGPARGEAPAGGPVFPSDAAADEISQAVSQFTHDVAGPVTILLGLAEQLQDAPPGGDRVRNDLAEIRNAAEEIAARVKALRSAAERHAVRIP